MITCYFGIEASNMTGGQKNTIVTGLQGLGDNVSIYPNFRNHWRVRNDDNAMIFEARFDDTNLTILAMRTRLASSFSVSLASITTSTQDTVYGKVIDFSYLGVLRMRMIAFGMNAAGAWGTWAVSGAAARAYVATNSVDWTEVA